MSEQLQHPPRRCRWKRWAWGILIVFLTCFLSLIGIAAFFDEPISRRLLGALSAQVRTEWRVQKAGLSLIRSFPEAAIYLEGIQVKDAFGRYLLQAREVSFRFRLFSLFGRRIEVKKIIIRGGSFNVLIDKRGRANYDIFKTDGRDKQSSDDDLQLSIENAEVKDVYLTYDNASTQQSASINLKSAGVAGNFSARQFTLLSQADMTIARLQVGDSRYLLGQPLRYHAAVAVDWGKGLYDVQNVELWVGGNAFEVSGFLSDKGAFSDVNLQLTGREGDVSLLVALLPEPYSRYFSDFHSSGTYTFTASVRGKMSKTQLPTVEVAAALQKGMVASEKLQSPLRDVSFRMKYRAAPSGESVFEVADFTADFAGHPLALQLKVGGFQDAQVDFLCQGALPIAAAYGLLNNPMIGGGDGVLRISNLSVQGKYSDMVDVKAVSKVHATAEIEFDGVSVLYNRTPVQFSSGRVTLEGNLLRIDSVQTVIGRSDGWVQGYVENALPVLFADSTTSAETKLVFSTRAQGQFLDLGQLLDLFASTDEPVPQDSSLQGTNPEHRRLLRRLKGTFEMAYDAFAHRDVRGQRLNALAAIDDGVLHFRADVRAMKGEAQLAGVAHLVPRLSLKMCVTLRAVDLKTLMEQCNNFDQDVITDKNLRGTLSGRLVAYAFWDEQHRFLMDELRVLADVRATEGELVGVKMLEDFSGFIHLEDLRRVRFADLQNYLEIKHRTLYVPVMLVQSNALNITLSGTHTFDNVVDYRIKVNVGQVLLQRIKRHDPDLEPLPAREGWFNVFYTIRGQVDKKYDMKRGKKEVMREFERSEELKRSVARRIEDEFRGISGRPSSSTETAADDKTRPGAVSAPW